MSWIIFFAGMALSYLNTTIGHAVVRAGHVRDRGENDSNVLPALVDFFGDLLDSQLYAFVTGSLGRETKAVQSDYLQGHNVLAAMKLGWLLA